MRRTGHGQSMAEFALVVPVAMTVIFGIIAIGLWIFYQQQVTNVAREAARFAAIHSATAPCPTVGWRDPQPSDRVFGYYRCDSPNNASDPYPWPAMTGAARRNVWGIAPSRVFVNACWSGYVDPSVTVPAPDYSAAAGFPLADLPALNGAVENTFVQCRIGGVDPTTDAGSLACGQGLTVAADDPASSVPFNQVTAYACLQWSPPLAGFLLIPSNVTMRAVVTEVIHRQQ